MIEGLPLHDLGAGRPIVFLHGWTMDGAIFRNQFERLAPRFRCLAPDLPGHGDNAAGNPTIEEAVRRLRDLIDRLNLSDAILVGWSLGAAIAWRYIADHNAHGVAAMISVDMSPKLVNERGWKLGLRGKDADGCFATTARLRDHWAASVPAIAAGMFADRKGTGDLSIGAAVEKIASNDPAAMLTMWQSLLAADARTAIAELPVPLLAIYGCESRVYAAETAQWLARTAPDGRCLGFKNSGHSPHLEEPDAFARAVATFAEKHGGADLT